jgi:hypothetical protein
MNIYQIGSVVLQIGIAAIVIVLLYGLHAFMEGFEKDDRELLIRLRYARRWSDQEWLTTLKEFSDKRFTSPSTVGFDQEDRMPINIGRSSSKYPLSDAWKDRVFDSRRDSIPAHSREYFAGRG